MKKLLFKAGVGLTALLASAMPAQANDVIEQVQRYSNESVPKQNQAQVQSVNQLRDVSPNDWAYEALRNLVERYGCIEGFPDQTYRGNRATTRYEFAAGLNACLNSIERSIAQGETVVREDLATLQRLVQEFEAELAALGARVDNLEGRVAFLEENQFSTTTKLGGEAIFAVGQLFNGDEVSGFDADEVAVFGDRIRLELNTSFTGEDLLFTRLATGNFPAFADQTGIFQGDVGFAQPEDNDIALEVLYYLFPIGESTQIYVAAAGGAADDFTPTVNFLDGDGATGAVSAFGTRNPIYFTPEDAGLAILQELGDSLLFTAGYLANPANEAESGSGLFNGPFSVVSQLTFTPTERFSAALTYVYNYNQSDTGTGTRLANIRSFFDGNTNLPTVPGDGEDTDGLSTNAHSVGAEFSWQISDRFVLGGWGAYTNVNVLSTLGGLIEEGNQDIVNWAVTLALPDLGKEGSVAGVIVGSEPFVVNSDVDIPGVEDEDEDFSLHVEGFYQYQLTDNINITPGVIWITAPNGDEDLEDQVIGVLRTTFSF